MFSKIKIYTSKGKLITVSANKDEVNVKASPELESEYYDEIMKIAAIIKESRR